MTQISITNRNVFLSGIKQKVLNQAFPVIFEGIHDILLSEIFNAFLKFLGRHPVILGLQGFYAGDEERDLAAIFGLDDSMASDAVDFIYDTIQQGMSIDFTTSNTAIKISLITDNIESYLLNSQDGKYFYFSKKFNTVLEIDWMNWLINGGNTEAAITFDLKGQQIGASRSGRAVMTYDETLPSWRFRPEQVSRRGNFLSDVVQNRNFVTELQFAISRNIREYIESHDIEVF